MVANKSIVGLLYVGDFNSLHAIAIESVLDGQREGEGGSCPPRMPHASYWPEESVLGCKGILSLLGVPPHSINMHAFSHIFSYFSIPEIR